MASSINDSQIYYFLGNITSHVLHALPLFEKIGGTFIVTSKDAERKLLDYKVPVICIDNVPYLWQRTNLRPRRVYEYITLDKRFEKTIEYLNIHASVVIFYELFDLPEEITLQPKKIFLTHGNMLKNYFSMHPRRLEIIKKYDYMSALGPFMRRQFLDSGIPSSKLVDIGIARTDSVVQTKQELGLPESLKRAGISAKKPIVAYMPTYWGESSIDNLGIELLFSISEMYTVLFRPHPQTPKKILKKYHTILLKNNIHFVPESNSNTISLIDIFAASSLIIGDMSSVMLEAILIDKPLLFIGTAQKDKYSHKQISSIIEYSEKITDKNIRQVNTLIERAIKAGIDTKIWETAKQECFYNYKNDSVQAIVKFIKSLN